MTDPRRPCTTRPARPLRRPAAPPREVRGAGQAPGARAARAAARRGLLRRGGAARQLGPGRPGRRRRRHRHRRGRGAPGLRDGERSDREGRIVGLEDRREDHPHPGARAQPADPDGLPRRLGGRADHRPGADVPRPPRGGEDLPQRGQALRPGPAGLRAVRPQRGRGRLHPGVLRHRDHARRQRVDVPRLAADGGDGDRRDRDAGGDGRRADAHRHVGLRAHAREERRRGDRRRAALPRLLPDELGAGRRRSRPRPRPRPPRRSARSSPRTRTSRST